MPILQMKNFPRSRMRTPGCTMSPVSWIFLSMAVFISLIVLFRPTLWELFYLHIIDMASFSVLKNLEVKFFLKRYPDVAVYFPEISEEKIAALDEAKKKDLFESLVQLPDRRALWCVYASVVKVVPAAICIIFLWHAEGSRFLQFFKFFAYFFLVHSYFYANIYFDTHYFVSDKIREFHHKYNWNSVFRTAKFPSSLSDFGFQERISIGGIFFAILYLQVVLLYSHRFDFSLWSLAETVALGIFGFVLLTRTWMLARNYFMNGLTVLFQTFQELSNKNQEQAIPLHSSPALARFENIFNELTDNLRRNERELLSWITHETEQSRYRALGEVAGLVVHDLAGPLHTLQFCVEEMKENQHPTSSVYFNQIEINAKRAAELVGSLRTYLRNADSSVQQETSFATAHQAVLLLLRTQFMGKEFSQIVFHIEKSALNLKFSVSQSDLIHILYNLYKNSLENFIKNAIDGPWIAVEAVKSDLNEVHVLSVSDNGTGLSVETYENLTAYRVTPSKNYAARKGMGLRLTRRLVERLQGSLSVLETETNIGTTFMLTLPALTTTAPIWEQKGSPEASV